MSLTPANSGGGESAPQVTAGERTAGTEAGLRSFSPDDVAVMAGIHGPGGTPSASAVVSTPAGDLSSTDVQAALNELDAEKQPLDAVLTNTTASFLVSQETKLGHIAVTQPVNLDTMESNIATNNAKTSYTDAAKVAFLTVTQAVNLDTMESNIATNNAKTSYTDAAKVAFLTVTQAVNLDTMESDIAANISNVVEDTTPQLGGNLDTNSNQFTGGVYVAGPWQAVEGTITGVDIECDTGTFFERSMSADFTPTLSGIPASPRWYTLRLSVLYTSGALTLTAFTSLEWDGNTVPTLTAGHEYYLDFTTKNGGTSWRACVAGDFY